jgi:hypothetical protein
MAIARNTRKGNDAAVYAARQDLAAIKLREHIESVVARIVRAHADDVRVVSTAFGVDVLTREVGPLDRDDVLRVLQAVAFVAGALAVALPDDVRHELIGEDELRT